jgi:hypothetical protein
MEEFAKALMKAKIPAQTKLPISTKCRVIANFYCTSKDGKCITSYAESLLDCLVYCGIIKNKGHRIVNNIDGSRIYYDATESRVDVYIRSWGSTVRGKNK